MHTMAGTTGIMWGLECPPNSLLHLTGDTTRNWKYFYATMQSKNCVHGSAIDGFEDYRYAALEVQIRSLDRTLLQPENMCQTKEHLQDKTNNNSNHKLKQKNIKKQDKQKSIQDT